MVLAVQSRPHTMHAAIRGLGGTVLAKGPLTLVIDEVGLFINHRTQEPTGVDAWVRLFMNGSELPVDPHRIFINPPLIHDRIYDPRTAFEVILWQSVLNVPNPKGWRTRGTVTTVYAGAADSFVTSVGSTYASARGSSGGNVDFFADDGTGLFLDVNHYDAGGEYVISESFISFDTSSLPDSDTISAAELTLWLDTPDVDRAWTLQARTYNWGASVTTADWRGGAAFAALTLLATISAGSISPDAANTLTENGTNLQSAVSKTGTTYMVLGNSNYAANSAPTGNEYVGIYSADNTGTTKDPKLVVTHASAGTTATIASLVDEITAALSVNQYDRVTIASSVDELTASLNAYMAPSPRITSALDELQSLLNMNQTQQVTIGATLDEMTCSISLNMAPTATIAATVDELTASLNVDQASGALLTVAATLDELEAALSAEQIDLVTIGALLDEVSASLNIEQPYQVTVGSSVDELTAALSVNQAQQVTIGATVDEISASLSLEQRILLAIAAVIDEATASLSVEQRYLLTIGSTLDEAIASLTIEQRILLSVASALDELQTSLNAQQAQQVTIGASVDELTASLSLEQRVYMAIAGVINEAVGSLAVNQTNVLAIAALLDELTASLDVSLLNFIFPEIGKILMALDRNETLVALRGLDATQTLMALARDDTLFALQGYDGIEALRALDRDEALNPLEART